MSDAERTVVVGMSGGVDSSVAALLLKQQGYRVIGLFMKNWEDDDDDEYCSTREDLVDAAAAADVVGVEFEAVNFAAQYKDRVFVEFLREYAAGRTPNPDVLCNAEIKFKAFLDHAIALGAGKIATGHYAGVREREGQFQLLRAADASKDQSYFLHRLTQAQLSRVLFPLAGLQKSAVRRIAQDAGLGNHAKKDSTGICFIGERPFREFLNRYLPKQPGAMLDERGKVIGEHIGLMFYTLGQRKGVGVGGKKSGSGEPWFVARKDVAANTLTIVQGHDHPWLQARGLDAENASWVAGVAPVAGKAYGAKTRYRQTDALCHVASAATDDAGRPGLPALAGVAMDDEATAVRGTAHSKAPAAGSAMPSGPAFAMHNRFRLQFDAPQWAVTPGQSAVLYDGDVCLGGGIIAAST